MITPARRFNLRVYGLLADRGRLLTCREPFGGRTVTKLPGGGVEWGEGPEEALRRELLEEMGQPTRILGHIYTTGFFVRSAIRREEQIVSIYYAVAVPRPDLVKTGAGRESIVWEWKDLDDLRAGDFDLPVDRYLIGEILEGRLALSGGP